ncbi:tyrosine-type recombinase/integrase [Alcaligenaceae bacterium B3P038]|nr:tyrosine-type recombinase/integrase [Alcaligenaceae bacterium B3P038]
MHEAPPVDVATFRAAAERYFSEIVPTKAARTQIDNTKELENVYAVFDNPPALLSKIESVHISKYIRWRMGMAKKWYAEQGRPILANAGHVRANREVALFSHIFNFARSIGLTSCTNPCAGVPKNKESGRDTYVEDDMYAAVWKAADQPLSDAMDLAYLTGQRPADTLKFTDDDVRDGMLHLQQNKTKTRAKLRIEIQGDLAEVIKRIQLRKAARPLSSTALIVNEKGEKLGTEALRSRFDSARVKAGVAKQSFQFRDLRAKASTDKTDNSGDIRQAQKQLGHTSVSMTEGYVRNRRGSKSTPTK